MICHDPQRLARGHRSVNHLATLTKPFRIQVQDLESQAWRIYANFRFQGEAEACLDALRQRGIEARLDSTELAPVAS